MQTTNMQSWVRPWALGLLAVGLGSACAAAELPGDESVAMSAEELRNGTIVTPWAPGSSAPAETRAIVHIGGCTGTVIEPDWVLSATHCGFGVGTVVTSERPTGNVSRTVDRVHAYPGIDGVLLHLSTPFNDIPRVSLFPRSTATLVAQPTQCYGYGAQATNNTCSPTVACPAGQWCQGGWCLTPSAELRTGQLPTAADGTRGYFRTLANSMGQMALPGDSGGPCFTNGALAGVNSWWNFDLSGGGQVSVPEIRQWIYEYTRPLTVFARGQDNAVWQRVLQNGAWQGWSSLGGVVTTGPAVTVSADGKTFLFARGQDNAVWHRSFDGNGWSGWSSLGGYTTSAPAAAVTPDGKMYLFARGGDNALYQKIFDNGWSGWASLGGNLTSAAAVTLAADGKLSLFARGTDNAIYQKKQQGNGWTDWSSLGGNLAGAPSATVTSDGKLVVFARGSNAEIWHKWYDGGWSGWVSLGGVLSEDPGATRDQAGRLVVFARGGDNAVWHKWLDGAWSAWVSLNGVVTSSAAAL